MLLTVVVAAFLLGLTACGSGTTGKAGAHLAGASDGSPAGSAPPASSLTETGSTLLFPLMQTWAAEYRKQFPDVIVSTAATGSTAGITDASAGTADIGTSDAYLSSGNLVKNPALLNIPLVISAQQVDYNLPGLLNLISRSGDTSFEQNFRSVRDQIGPGTGTLLTSAASASRGQAVAQVTAAARDAPGWYAANEQVYHLDLAAAYAAETKLVIGAGPGSSAAGYIQLESDISRAIADDLSTFQSNATAGASAFGPLEGVVIIAALLMAGGCARGLGRRIGEYR